METTISLPVHGLTPWTLTPITMDWSLDSECTMLHLISILLELSWLTLHVQCRYNIKRRQRIRPSLLQPLMVKPLPLGALHLHVISPLKERDRSQRNAHLNNYNYILRSQILFLLLSININTRAKINSVNRLDAHAFNLSHEP